MTYSDEFKQLWVEFNGGAWGENIHKNLDSFVAFKAGWDACQAAIEAQKAKTFGCFVDGATDIYPDCVIGTDRSDDCTYAKKLTSPEQCKYWREVEP